MFFAFHYETGEAFQIHEITYIVFNNISTDYPFNTFDTIYLSF